MKSLVEQIFESPNENELVAAVLPKDRDKEHQDISQDVNDMRERTWQSRRSWNFLMITNTILCKSYCNYKTPGHTFNKCGLRLFAASDEIKKQDLHISNKCFFNGKALSENM